MIEWKSVKDELPVMKDHVFLPTLVFRRSNPYPTTRIYIWNGKWNTTDIITHWDYYNLPNGNHPNDD